MSESNPALEQFIRTHLETVDQLRAFLLLCLRPVDGISVDELAAKLYIHPPVAAEALARLEATGLAGSDGDPKRYRCRPRTPELEEIANALLILDREKPVTLLNMLYARPKGIQAFPDAFRLRKERND